MQPVVWPRSAEAVDLLAHNPAIGADAAVAMPQSEHMVRTAHELRAPAVAMLGLAELMATDAESPPAARHAGYLEHLVSAGKHLVALIDELLDLSRARAGQLPVSCVPVDLNLLADEALAVCAADAAVRRITITVDKAPSPALALADRRRTVQVLMNLLSNATRYNGDAGQVAVRVGPGPKVAITDTGPGLAPEQLAQLFEPFNRLGRDEDGPEGTGIGLALSRDLVRLMGGSLHVASTPGVGTTVTMVLPTAATPQGHNAGRLASGKPWARTGRTGYVLCIDANPVNAMLLQEFFRLRGGLLVRVASSASDGLALAHAERPLAVLLDLSLPDMPGLELLQRLRAERATCDIPVAVVSGCVNAEELQRARQLGARACWAKPLDLSRVESQLAELMAPGACA